MPKAKDSQPKSEEPNAVPAKDEKEELVFSMEEIFDCIALIKDDLDKIPKRNTSAIVRIRKCLMDIKKLCDRNRRALNAYNKDIKAERDAVKKNKGSQNGDKKRNGTRPISGSETLPKNKAAPKVAKSK